MYRPMETPLVIRGRRIAESDIVFIRSIIERHQTQGREFIAQELCRLWDWKQSNGMAKTMACSELLLRLERAGHVVLPPRKKGPGSGPRRRHPIQIPFHNQSPIEVSLREIGCIEIRMVRGPPARDRNIPLIVQNTRFLILPWVHVPHLASHLLGKMVKLLPQDWQKIYQ